MLDRNSLGDNEYIIKVEENYIQLHANGLLNLPIADSFMKKTVQVCKAHNCYKILAIGFTSKVLLHEEAEEFIKLFKDLAVPKDFKFTWVELNPETYESQKNIETILLKEKQHVRLFYDVQHAKKWLLAD
jgi:hypothetical protein